MGILKRLTCLCMSGVLLLGAFSNSIVAKADSNDRISAFIGMAAGKSVLGEEDLDLNLSESDMRFLGVYISNFFVPFGTEFGVGGSSEKDEDVTAINKEDIKKALQTNLSFNDSLAESFTETLMGLSRASVKELTLYVSTKKYSEGGELTQVPNYSMNYYNFIQCMFGKIDKTLAGYRGSVGAVKDELLKGSKGKYHYGYLCYQGEDGLTPMFDFSLFNEDITASQIAFFKCLESVDITKGYGLNFFDFTNNEADDSVFASLAGGEASNSEALSMSAYGIKIDVDCFGNLIAMGGNHQYVMVPGCMNPYTWITVASNGSDSGKAGDAYNMVNIPSMAMADQNLLLSSISKAGDVQTGGVSGTKGMNYIFGLSIPMCRYKGIYTDSKKIWDTSKIGDDLQAILDHCGGKGASVNRSGDNIVITGTVKQLSSVNYKKVSECTSELKNIDRNFTSLSSTLIKSEFKKLAEKAKDQLNGSGNDKTDVSTLKTGTFKLDRLNKALQDAGASGGKVPLRVTRGSSSTNFGGGIAGWGGNDARDLAKKAEEGFREANSSDKTYFNAPDGIKASDWWGTAKITINSFGGGQSASSEILDSMVFVDDLGAFHFDNSGEDIGDYTALNIDHYMNDSGSPAGMGKLKDWNTSDNGFCNIYQDIKSGKLSIPQNISKEAVVSTYIAYAFAGLYDESAVSDTIGKLGWRMNISGLPSIPDEPLELSDDAKSDIMLTSIRDWMYYMLHPTEGFSYFKLWLTNKLNSFLVGIHDDIVGTRGTGSINGTTKYRGFAGYVTTPEMSDLPWTNSLLNIYNTAIPFFMVFMLLLMLGAYISGVLSLQRALISFGIFALCVALPPIIINNLIGTSNRFSSALYGEKFTYWALVQHESYSDAIDKAASGDSYSNYLRTLYATNSQAKGNQGEESIMLKWQAPKKMASLMFTDEDKDSFGGIASDLISATLNNTYSGESYLDEDSVYLYRSYIDIANFSMYIHRGLDPDNAIQGINLNITNENMAYWDNGLKNAIKNYGTNYEKDRTNGYANKNDDGSTSGTGNGILRVRLPLNSTLVNEQLGNMGKLDELGLSDYVGINQDAFKFSIPMFNVKGESFTSALKTDNFKAGDYTNEDFSSLASYGLMSENPFYYFSWYLYESGLSTDINSTTGYKNLLLGEDNAAFFYNTEGNGEMKDFMDMRSLFTYIIPYLNQCNALVKEWDDIYGIFIYDGVPTEEGHQNDPDIKGNKELQQKYWHNLNVARLYNMYTPWVDVMYDCSYADPEKIQVLGEDYVVQDPLNPASYPSERPMIFSRSEMKDYGLSEKDLTEVELKILECEEGMQERMFNLLNYHTFNDVVLNTAAAMNCAFEFNTTFSENGLFTTNHNIYPQSFELNDFSYDAFLRFILSNSTGESMIVENGGDFYQNIVDNSSTMTAILMLILDLFAVYAVPAFKILFVVGLFIMLILMIASSHVDQEFKFVQKLLKNFVNPMVKFIILTCGLSFAISLFMGSGSSEVTGELTPSIQLGDPSMVILVMTAINGLAVYMYFKILWDVWKNVKHEGKIVGNSIGGIIGAVASMGIAGALSGRGKSNVGYGEGYSGGSRSRGSSMKGTGSQSSSGGTATKERVIYKSSDEDYSDREKYHRDARMASKIRDDAKEKSSTHSTKDIEDKTSRGFEKLREGLNFRESKKNKSDSNANNVRKSSVSPRKKDKE